MRNMRNKTHNLTSAILCHSNIHIWVHSLRLPATYDGVMKHKTHTVIASGEGKDRMTDRIEMAAEPKKEKEMSEKAKKWNAKEKQQKM